MRKLGFNDKELRKKDFRIIKNLVDCFIIEKRGNELFDLKLHKFLEMTDEDIGCYSQSGIAAKRKAKQDRIKQAWQQKKK